MAHENRILLASEARTTTQTTADQTNAGHRGIHLSIDVTAVTSTPILTPKIQGKDAAGIYYTILEGAAISATGQNVLKVYPGLTPTANAISNDVLPPIWRVVVTATDADSATYSVSAALID